MFRQRYAAYCRRHDTLLPMMLLPACRQPFAAMCRMLRHAAAALVYATARLPRAPATHAL